MNELKIFENPEFGKIRTVSIDGEPWLAGKDVAKALGYKNTKDALASHVDDLDKRLLQRSEFATFENHLPKSAFPYEFVNGEIPNRGLTFINESGVYSLAFSSKLPTAKKFKRWVTSEVLPSIRKTGGYSQPDSVQLVTPAPPELSLSGLASVSRAARRAVLDMGGSRWDAGVEVLAILNYYGLPVPEFAPNRPRENYIRLRPEDFFV